LLKLIIYLKNIKTMLNLKKNAKSKFIEISIKDLKGIKRAEWYKARSDKYKEIAYNTITDVCTFEKIAQ
jgi:hypothetical protein